MKQFLTKWLCIASLTIPGLHAAHTPQAWYNRAASSAGATLSGLNQQAPWRNWSVGGATSSVKSFSQQNPYLMASILSAIGLGTYWAFKRMLYKGKYATMTPRINYTLRYPNYDLPAMTGLCPAVSKMLPRYINDMKFMASGDFDQAATCSTCGQAHKISLMKQSPKSPIYVEIVTGKSTDTLPPVNLQKYASEFFIPRMLMAGNASRGLPQSQVQIEEIE